MTRVFSRLADRVVPRLELITGLLVLAVVSSPVELLAQGARVMFVLDGSNSMWGRIDGTEKIVVAREVLAQALAELPDDVEVGLAAYGHRREQACDDIEILLPLGDHPSAEVERAIRSVQPRGMTPITGALQLVAEGLATTTEPTHLVLVSDGRETCEGDPCSLVRTLRESGLEVTVHVVGFDVTGDEKEQLECIAEAGGGSYFDARSGAELTAALGDIRESVVLDVASSRSEPVPIDRSKANWRIESDDAVWEGRFSRFFVLDGDPMIQLINEDAVNVGLAFTGDMSGERTVTYAMFGEGRGPICELVGEEGSFRILFEPSEDGWLSGTFSGMLGCPEYRAMPVRGSFHIEAPPGTTPGGNDG